MRNFLILHNPNAGKRTDGKRIDKLTDRLTREGFDWTLDESLYHNYFTDKYQAVPHLPYSDIVVCGGDGTIHEVVNLFWQHDVTLSIYPVGSGNDFYLKAGGKLNVDELIERIVGNHHRLIDAARLNERIFINNAGIGLDVETLKIAEKLRKYKIKRAGYKLAAAMEIMRFKPVHGFFRVDGEEFSREFMIAVVCNGAYFGGGMMISPDSRLDDGKLELVLLKRTGRLQLINLFGKIFSGQHVGHKDVEIRQAKKIEIFTDEAMTYHAEGELLGTTPLTIEVLPQALRIIA